MYLRRCWLSMMPMGCRSFSSEDLAAVVVDYSLLVVAVEDSLLARQPCEVAFLTNSFLAGEFGFRDFSK